MCLISFPRVLASANSSAAFDSRLMCACVCIWWFSERASNLHICRQPLAPKTTIIYITGGTCSTICKSSQIKSFIIRLVKTKKSPSFNVYSFYKQVLLKCTIKDEQRGSGSVSHSQTIRFLGGSCVSGVESQGSFPAHPPTVGHFQRWRFC